MDSKWVLMPLLCLPLAYQVTLLWNEFLHGTAAAIFHRHEPFIDLPAVTVCVPLKYTFTYQLILSRIKTATDSKNECFRYREMDRLLKGNASRGDLHQEMRKSYTLLDLCASYYFMHSDPMEPFNLQQALRGNETLSEADFLSGHILWDKSPLGHGLSSGRSKVQPNLVSFDTSHGKCFTYFSRATHDWIDSASGSLYSRHSRASWYRTADGDIVPGRILSTRRPEVWPYRVRSIKSLAIQVNFLGILKHFYEKLDVDSLRHYLTTFSQFGVGDADRPITVALHSPFVASGYTAGGWSVNQLIQHFHIIKSNADRVLYAQNLSLFNMWSTSFSKTTLVHLTASNSYSDYMKSPFAGNIQIHEYYSADDCVHTGRLVQQVTDQLRLTSRFCLPLDLRAVNENFLDRLVSKFGMSHGIPPFCHIRNMSDFSNATIISEEAEKLRLTSLLKEFREEVCPLDALQLVYKFRSELMRTKETYSATVQKSPRSEFIINVQSDTSPELTIKYVSKMALIEFFASLCGLCGIWLGFSMLGTLKAFQSLFLRLCKRARKVSAGAVTSQSKMVGMSNEKKRRPLGSLAKVHLHVNPYMAYLQQYAIHLQK